VACRKRYARNLGSPISTCRRESRSRYTDIEARTGETLKQSRPEPDERCGTPEKEGEHNRNRANLPDAHGVSYQA